LNRLNLSGISADAERRQLLLIRGEDHRLCAMSDVVAVEVLADGSAIVKANRGSQALGAVVGGALLGPLGLLAGAITGSTRSEDRIKKLALRVVTTDFERPNHDVLFFESASPKGDKRDSDLLRPALQLAEKWNSRLTSMLRDSKASADQQSTRPPISVADELRKLADLRRDGILTQDEFEAQKRRLLEQ
jgi:hypothetical protein